MFVYSVSILPEEPEDIGDEILDLDTLTIQELDNLTIEKLDTMTVV